MSADTCPECGGDLHDEAHELLRARLKPPPVTGRSPNPLLHAPRERLAAYRARLAEIARCRRA